MMHELTRIDAQLVSSDENTRWQAAIALGNYCETAPETIWPLVEKWGSSDDMDRRSVIGTCVLEHILEYHFAVYFAKTEQIIYAGSKNFPDTFRTCWQFGQAKLTENTARWEALAAFIAAREAAE